MEKRKAGFLSELHITDTIHPRYIELTKPLGFYSEILESEIWAQSGFICDKESVPVIEGTSIRGGVFHDYLSRFDSEPNVSKLTAAKIYLEVMKTRDIEIIEHFDYGNMKQLNMLLRRNAKYATVVCWPGYFHKLSVKASLENILVINHRF